MDSLLRQHLHDVLELPKLGSRLAWQSSLRAAAATLSHTPDGAVRATTVVGVLGLEDAAPVRALVAELAETYGLEATLEVHVRAGSFSVRFARGSEG